MCAWQSFGTPHPEPKRLVVIRDSRAYGCVHGGAIVADPATGKAGMIHPGEDVFHPLSLVYGGVLQDTALESEIKTALTSA